MLSGDFFEKGLFNSEKHQIMLLEFLVESNTPFNVVECQSFIDFMSTFGFNLKSSSFYNQELLAKLQKLCNVMSIKDYLAPRLYFTSMNQGIHEIKRS